MKTFLRRSLEDLMNVGQKMRFRRLSLFAIAILPFLALTGCMLLPNSASRVDKTQPVLFLGGVKAPNVPITIEAKIPQNNNWDKLGTIISPNYKVFGYGSDSAYLWFDTLMIPPQYWAQGQECASTGESALVRAKWDAGELPSVRGDVLACYSQHPGDGFFSHCTKSGGVRVGALDYRDFGQECADLINRIRYKEGKTPLQIDEAGECGADKNAQCNYEWELSHDEAHKCPGPGAQNETTYKSSAPIDSLLDQIDKGMYLQEKQCWLKNPPTNLCGTQMDGCYLDPNCMCGHYVNMVVCPNYTKISCGLYKVSDGNFKSVQNFE
jgi:hypothetical protein